MKRMYTLQAVAPREHSVSRAITDLIETKGWQDKIGQIIIPENKVMEVKNNKPKTVMKRMYPGYIFIEIEEDFDDAFVAIPRLNNALGFVGVGKSNRPAAMSAKEVKGIMESYERGQTEEVQAKHEFKPGHKVRILNGPFMEHTGTVANIDLKKDTVTVSVLVFGRPVDMQFSPKELDLEA